MDAKWYIVYTRAGWEHRLTQIVTRKKIENYCPLNLVKLHWNDPKKNVYQPLFTSYVFVRVSHSQHEKIRKLSGVIGMVLWLNQPAVISDEEIELLRSTLQKFHSVRTMRIPVDLNERGRTVDGPDHRPAFDVAPNAGDSTVVSLPSLGYILMAGSNAYQAGRPVVLDMPVPDIPAFHFA